MKTNTMIVRYTKRAALSLLAWMICWNLYGQLERDQVQVAMDQFDIRQVKLGDMDGDGDQDVVASSRGLDGHVAIFENVDGQGSLAWPKLYGDSIWTESAFWNHAAIELADMDGDGDLDVVDAYRALETTPYWENDGQGNLQDFSGPPPVYSPIYDEAKFRVADINGDGSMDIVYVDLNADAIRVNFNMGNGADFQLETTLLPSSPYRDMIDMELGDYDQDGDLDIYLLEGVKENDLLLLAFQIVAWDGTAFNPLGRSYLETELDKFGWFDCDMSIIHVDGNGFPDAVYTHTGHGSEDREYMVYLQIDPVDGQAELAWQSDGQPFVSNIVVDTDQDDDEDLIAFDPSSGYFLVEQENGILNQGLTLLDSVPTGRWMSAGDLDGDGAIDLLTHWRDNTFSDDPSSMFGRLGPLSAGNTSPPFPLNRGIGFIRDKQLWDWDADGALDILFCDESGIAWIRNEDGGMSFSSPDSIWETPDKLSHFEFAPFGPDSLLGGIASIQVDVFRYYPLIWQTGTTTPYAFPSIEMKNRDHFDVSDIDGDGDLDVAVVTKESSLFLLWNELNTSGSWVAEEVIPLIPMEIDKIWGVLLEDLDQDGYGDLVLRGDAPACYALHLDGEGNFGNWKEIEGLVRARTLFAGDYNLDGLRDLRWQYSELGVEGRLMMTSYHAALDSFTPVVERGVPGDHLIVSEVRANDDDVPDLITVPGFCFNIGISGFISAPFVPSPFEDRIRTMLAYNVERGDLDGNGEDELVSGMSSIIVYQPGFSDQQLVEGQLVWDTTSNCTFNPDWPGMPNGQLLLEGQGSGQQVLSTTTAGDYGGYLPDTLPHTLSPILPSDYWVACPPDTLLQGTGPHEADFAVSAAVSCPLMELELSMEPIRQCFNSSVVLRYENTGTANANSVSIQLVFDSRMTPASATLAWSAQTDTSLTFDLGGVAVGGSGQIVVDFAPDCQELILGEVLCYRASITPDTLCDPGLVGWEGGNLEARFTCGTDSLEWRIENTGYGPVSMPVPYELSIVNDDIVLLENGDVEILPGEFVLLTAPIDSSAYLLEAGQPDGHPAPEPIRMLSSGCITALDTGLVLAFPNNNGDPFTVEQCEPVIGAYDPNIKVAYPAGFGPEHHIPAEEELQYTIHFQNVGTDMARNVTIRDTLSSELDLSTFRAAGGSHEHQWYLLPDRVLVIEYPEILLPDSISNEPESHGFFSFSIKPREGVLPGTLIENKAGIYFDFNPPVITNTVFHTIEKLEVASAVYATVCPGDLYLDQLMTADTILEERHMMVYQDSVIWHHVNVLTPDDTTVVMVSLEEPGWWDEIEITEDTSIVEVYTSTAGCDSTVLYVIDVITALEEVLGAKVDWLLSPNPAQDECWLNARTQAAVPERIRLFSTQGQAVRTYDLRSARLPLRLPLQGLSEGLYWVELRGSEERQVIPLSIIRKN